MAEELKPAYLLAGTDRPKVERALRRLRDRFPANAIERHSARDTSPEDLIAVANALGLFAGEGRLIVVEDAESWKAADAKAIGAYLKAPAPATTLAFVGGELKKDGPLAKTVAAAGEVLIWDVPQRGLQGWVAEQFTLQGSSADPEACRALVELVGDDLNELATEIDKLVTWSDGTRLTAGDVEALVAARAGASNFALTDAWGARDVTGVLLAAERALERTADPPSRSIPRVVGTLTNHVTRLHACQTLEADGLSPAEAASRLKQHPYYVRKLFGQARNFTADELRDVTVRLAQLDHALKGGSRLSNELELERALVEITRAPEPAPSRPAG
jgi:DNA polymerase-3 subunit delta